MKKGIFRKLCICIVSGLLLVGCSENMPEVMPEVQESLKEEPETLTVSIWEYKNSHYYQEVVKAYEERTGNQIEVIDIPSNDYIDKLSDLLYSNQELDVILAKDIPSFTEMIRNHQLEPLDPYIEKYHTDLSGYNELIHQVRYEGKLYGLPFRNDYYLLFYNKDIFDEAGLPYPDNDMTWKEYCDLAARLTDPEKGIYGSHLHTWRMLVQNWAIQDGEHTVIADDYSFMKPAYEMALKMQNEDKSVMDFADLRAGNIHYRSMFHNGNIAMIPMGSWLINETIAAVSAGGTELENWGVAKLPHPEGVEPGYTMGASTQAAINVRSDKKEMAYEFLEFLCGAEGAEILMKNGAIPAWVDLDIRKSYEEVSGFPQECLDSLEVSHIVLESPVDKKMKEIDAALTKEHEYIMTGEKTIDQGLADMGVAVKEILEE